MTEGERLDFIIRHLEGGNASEFARKTGIIKSTICRIKSGQLRLLGKADAIIRAYPMVERHWLETGEGYCGDLSVEIVRNQMKRVVAEKDSIIKALTDELKLNQEVMRKLVK